MDNDVLVGKIVNWPNVGDETSSEHIGCGSGKVVAIVEPHSLLIRRIPRSGDTEPSYMLILPTSLPNLHFFNSRRDERKWYDWVFNNPNPVISLVDRE